MTPTRMSYPDLARTIANLTATIPHPHARTLTTLTHLLAHRLPNTLTTILTNLTALDGYPTTASGRDTGPHTNGIGRPVEHTAITRLTTTEHHPGPTIDLDDLTTYLTDTLTWTPTITDQNSTRLDDNQLDLLHLATTAINQAHQICDRNQPPADPRSPTNLRCQGTNTPTGAGCTNIADYRIDNHGNILDYTYDNDGKPVPLDHRCPTCRSTVAAELELDTRRRTATRALNERRRYHRHAS